MKKQSIYNMVMAIITAVIIIPLFVLGIIFTKNTLSVVLMCIYYPVLILHFILKACFYGKDESTSKEAMYRLSRCFLLVSLTLIGTQFILNLTASWKWVLFACITGVGGLEIILESIQKGIEVNVLLGGIKLFLWIWILSNTYTFSFPVMLGVLSPVIGYFSSLLGKTLENKLVLSFDMIAVILFGLFIIFI